MACFGPMKNCEHITKQGCGKPQGTALGYAIVLQRFLCGRSRMGNETGGYKFIKLFFKYAGGTNLINGVFV